MNYLKLLENTAKERYIDFFGTKAYATALPSPAIYMPAENDYAIDMADMVSKYSSKLMGLADKYFPNIKNKAKDLASGLGKMVNNYASNDKTSQEE